MKRVRIIYLTIAQGKINIDLKAHLTPTENVIEEGLFLFDFDTHDGHSILAVLTHNLELSVSRFLGLSNMSISG